jgi:hypothetical protein
MHTAYYFYLKTIVDRFLVTVTVVFQLIAQVITFLFK